MRLALQTLFSATEADEDGAARRSLLERRARLNERTGDFLRRLRDVVDDPALQAPEVFAEESFPDANVVAEYLDGQAPFELARAYEDVCWDSPEALAEAGRCYDILNNDALNCVVAPKNCRRRLYYIAWEDGCADVAPKSENEPVFDDWSNEPEKGGAETASVESVTTAKRKREKKARKSAKNANSVGSTLAAERSLGRRAKRAFGRTALALGLFGAIYCGWQTLRDDSGSETLRLETAPTEELAVSEGASEEDILGENLLCPTIVSELELDELSATSLGEPANVVENDGFDDYAGASVETPKLAALSNMTNEGGEDRTYATESTDGERTRAGLGGEAPWILRPSIEIPAQNNDVFSKTKRY
ncbi:MAG: hypothetical protein IIW01_09320 [Thermoguttaceae bacterium]|nr:hypothetical protein [Thermoguttaceae bacterium]